MSAVDTPPARPYDAAPLTSTSQPLLFPEDDAEHAIDREALAAVRRHDGLTAGELGLIMPTHSRESIDSSLARLSAISVICQDRQGRYFRVT